MVYNYTKPRGPVAAANSGPGPCYGLPTLVGYKEHDPRSSHSRGPSYQFGIVHSTLSGACSPGPCHYPDSKTLRTGRDYGPHYTIYARLPEISRFKVPAPGTYGSDVTSPRKPTSPAYSFGIVCPPLTPDMTPGPNAYRINSAIFGRSIESTKRQSPSFSIYSRSKNGSFDEDYQKTPGPGSYTPVDTNRYRIKYPQYSITGRNLMPADGTQKPGPGAHSPENVTIHRKSNPRFSFGIRHSEYEAPLILNDSI